MLQTYLLVFDLETIPDAAILPLDREPPSFPKPIQHQIVTLGFLLARILPDGQYERYEVYHLGTASSAERGERELLADFWQLIEQHRPRVVTWNGRSFDVPVLKQRSLVHGLTALTWHRTDPRYGYDFRYNPGWHCDLLDMLSDQGASTRLSLEEAASAIGLPGKMAGHGAAVAELLAAGETDRIDRYCEGDVLNTYALYLRWAYFSSRLSARGHNASVNHLVDYLENARSERPHLGEFLDIWQASRRPCPLYVLESAMEPGAQLPESHLRSEDVLP
jgi:predicted PolB exonuclease-like 3'-5' exonuclease